MLGALIGDCVGSFWEFSGNKDPSIPLWVPACHFTDDSVCTGATAQWLLKGGDYATLLHAQAHMHLNRGFAKKMLEWAMAETAGPAYGSWGNGSAMRVAPVALAARSLDEALEWAKQTAEVTHNHPLAVKGAQATVFAIRYAIEFGRENLLEHVEARFGYEGLSGRNPPNERVEHVFDVSCNGTVPLALAIAVKSGSFDDTLRWCCSMGGDADTLAAIAGPVAEMLYGIPQQHLHNVALRFHPEDRIYEEVLDVYRLPHVVAYLSAHNKISAGHITHTTDASGPEIGTLRYRFV